MWVRVRSPTNDEIRLHPIPPQAERDAGLWATGKEAIEEFCQSSRWSIDEKARRAETYAIADEALKEDKRKPFVEVKVKGKKQTLHYREILTPALIDPISKLRSHPAPGQSSQPERNIQLKALQRVLDQVYDHGTVNKDFIKFTINQTVGVPDSKRDNVKSSLQQMHPIERKAIREIMRSDKPLISDKEIPQFTSQIVSTQDTPFNVYIDKFHLSRTDKINVPRWIVIGLQGYLSGVTEEITLEQLVSNLLGKFLKEQGIENKDILEYTKTQLSKQWRL
jgi:hypothetical protein